MVKKKPSLEIPEPPKALNQAQANLVDALNHKELIVTLGPAGTGKSYLSACYAGYFYKLGKVNKIIITRPNIPTGKSLGYFPGYLEEKMANWVRPIIDTLEDYLSKGAVETMIKSGSIEVVPFETIRGRSWQEAFVILDEAQNTTKEEMKAFLTRIGEGCTTVINGDLQQSDLRGTNNGLAYLNTISNHLCDTRGLFGFIEFDKKDIVRSELCKKLIEVFELFP